MSPSLADFQKLYKYVYIPGYIQTNINQDFNGNINYIKPTWTNNKTEAATSFNLLITYISNTNYTDITKGAGIQDDHIHDYRYLIAQFDNNDEAKITNITLEEKRLSNAGWSCTGNLNKGRGGNDLFMCWSWDGKSGNATFYY